MYYEVYLDVFFFLNLWMNAVSCRLLAVLLRKRIRIRKICLVSFASSLASCLIVILPSGTMGVRMTAGQMIITPLTVFALFGDRGMEFFRDLASYYLTVFLFGGAVLYLKPHMTFSGILVTGTAAAAVLELIYRVFGMGRRQYFCDVTVKSGGGACTLKALFDSGNRLTEPIFKEQVHIIGAGTAKKLGLKENTDGVRVIPFHSIGKKNGVMMGYYADEMEVMGERGKIQVAHPLIGVSEEELSTEKEYEMILNSKIFD